MFRLGKALKGAPGSSIGLEYAFQSEIESESVCH